MQCVTANHTSLREKLAAGERESQRLRLDVQLINIELITYYSGSLFVCFPSYKHVNVSQCVLGNHQYVYAIR